MGEFDFYYEPFRAWNRLEPRPRHTEFDKVLECGVHDALWMLTRQWQFGELKGQDTGSAIFAKIQMQTTAISRFKEGQGRVQQYSDSIPLEKRIESISCKFDYKTRLETAFMFLQYAEAEAAKASVTGFSRKVFKERLKQLFPLSALPGIDHADPAKDILHKAALLSNEKLAGIADVSARKYFDGVSLYRAALGNFRDTLDSIVSGTPAHSPVVGAALRQFMDEFRKQYDDQPAAGNEAWNPQQLEYQFSCSVPEKDTSNTVLTADEYYTGDLDWYAFDVNKKESVGGLSGAANAEEMDGIKNTLLTVIPTQATFAGAPASRWWQFENGAVDLGNINAETTDIAKLIFTEYALLFNTDWFIVPLTVPVGSLCEIKGIVVKDVFGEQTFVEAAAQGDTDNWSGWGMFNLSTKHPGGLRDQPADTRLFIPPATVKTIESDPVEEVHFIRDEMTNNVWAIEAKLSNGLGGSMDGYQVARTFSEYLELYDNHQSNDPAEDKAMFRYSLANTVPENWIPFLPVHVKDSARAIQLQRASMPRLFRDDYTHIRPRTELLRLSINENDDQVKPYFIHEEEVPRAGVQLTSTFQRTRWYNGAVVNWYGYRKSTGKGEGSSGLVYDSVEAVKK